MTIPNKHPIPAHIFPSNVHKITEHILQSQMVPNIAMKNKRNIRVPETPSFTLPGFCQKNKTYPTQESINKYNI